MTRHVGSLTSLTSKQPPSSPSSPESSAKKPRRSQRINPVVQTEAKEERLEHTASPSHPGKDGAITPRSSSPLPFSDTQVASQVHFTQLDHKEEAKDVWGYLTPMNSGNGEVLTLSKRTTCSKRPEHNASTKKGAKKPSVGAGGYLIGRHAECDIVVEAPVVSNRHCVIFKVSL